MATLRDPTGRLRFAEFELDPVSLELFRDGARIPLQPQPARVLALLAGRAGALLSREEIQRQVWPDGAGADPDLGLNYCVRQIRAALGDDPERPRFVETLPRRGYRFVAAVTGGDAAALGARIGASRPRAKASRHVLVIVACLAVALVGWVLWRTVAGTRQGRVIVAVLPFTNLTGDPASEYVADGLTEELIGQLGAVQPDRLGVIARTSAMALKRSPQSLDAIARRLNAVYLLEGSVRGSGPRLRVSVRLVEASDQAQLWSASFEHEATDLLTLEAELARAVVGQVRGRLRLPGEPRRPPAGTTNREAYEACLQGRFHLRTLGREGAEKAIVLFSDAIELDPAYASAWAGLAESYYTLSNLRRRPEEAMSQARVAAMRALELDPASAAGHSSLALIKAFYDWDWSSADQHFRRAIDLDPGDADARGWYGLFLSLMGRFDEATSVLAEARRLDPLSATIMSLQALPPYLTGRYDEALRWSRATLELEPACFQAQTALGTTYEAMGDAPRAVVELKKAQQLEDSPVLLAFLARALAVSGDHAAAREILAHLLELRSSTFVSPYELALVYDGLGDHRQAMDWLERAFDERAEGMASLRVDPRLTDLRSEARFRSLLGKMRFPG